MLVANLKVTLRCNKKCEFCYQRQSNEVISVEDAEAYMEAVGHSFYVFLNGETGEINIIYKRNDGNLGLIEVRK